MTQTTSTSATLRDRSTGLETTLEICISIAIQKVISMARKVNTTINNNNYFRVTAEIGKTSDGKRIRKQFYGNSQKDAEQKRDAYLEQINRGLGIGFEKLSLGLFMKEWLFTVERYKLKTSSFARYESIYRTHIESSNLSAVPIASVKSIQIQKFYNDLVEVGKKPPTVAAINKLLKKFFNYCIKEDVLLKNPCTNVNLPVDFSADDKEVEVFDKSEIASIRDEVYRTGKHFIFVLALMTGLRQGELLALNVTDIDLDECLINVSKSAKHVTIIDNEGNRQYQREVMTTKSKASIRMVSYPMNLNPYIIDHIETEKNKHESLKLEYVPHDLLFTNEVGEPVDESNLRMTWKRFLKRQGIKYRKFHALRHTYCTLLAENGVSLKTASELMGHDINMTARIYTHVSQEEKKKASERIGHLI